MRRHTIIFMLLLMLSVFFIPQPEAHAMDPVTIAILAPIAIQVAKTMLPYILKGMKNFAKHMIKGSVNFVDILRLPLGFIQMFILFPFSDCFSSGLKNLGLGFLAPFKLAYCFLMIPFAIFGIGT